jgi:transcription termination factor Rho
MINAYPDVKLFCLLVDERPEEVTEFKRSIPCSIYSSSSDESYDHHIQVADKLMAEAYKLAGEGQDVVIIIDSLTRLSRVHNAERQSSGRTLSGGVDARSLEVPRRIFGSARKIEHGGSLTILASILIETGSRMDEVIFEEFKGTGNMEIVLSREIASHRIFPAIDIKKSATRKQELLLESNELIAIENLRKQLAILPVVQSMGQLVDLLNKYPTNQELLKSYQKV